MVIDLEAFPVQDKLPRPLTHSEADQRALDTAMQEFIDFRIVEKCSVLKTSLAFYSNIFPVIKKRRFSKSNTKFKGFTYYIVFSHFKMDTIKDVIYLLFPNCFFMSGF